LSSITERLRRLVRRPTSNGESGQVLVIFAGGLVAIIAVAALVFDTGQSLVDRRTQQNAADAASLAGARYLPTATGTYQGDCDDRTGGQKVDPLLKAVNAACDVAEAYLDADGMTDRTITVKVPPGPETQFSGLPFNIEVNVDSTRPSIFAGILGLADIHTGALAVAENSSGFALPYSLLSLDPHGCGESKITGTATVDVAGTIHVDSDCSPDALLVSGSGAVDAPSCDAVGSVQVSGGGTGCDVQVNGAQFSGDPLGGLLPPSVPTTLGHFVQVSGTTKAPPASCPNGAATASVTAPMNCTFGSVYAGKAYRMWPGYYPGGLNFNAGTFYMEPGIYYIGGGGFRLGGNGAILITVDAGGTSLGGGVLIFDSAYSDPAYCTGTAPGVVGSGCIGSILFDGAGATAMLRPIQTTIYMNMLIFVDRITTDPRVAVHLNGSDTTTTLEGTIYAPTAITSLNGNASNSIATQVIAYDFVINGGSASLTVTYDSDKLFQLKGVGLVQLARSVV
jgi:Flp pilus assembly protein TadG